MGVRTVTTREFICENCGEGDVFAHDGEAGLAGWALLTVNGKEFALCPIHYQQLKDLLMVDGFPIPANPSMMPPAASPRDHAATGQWAGSHIEVRPNHNWPVS